MEKLESKYIVGYLPYGVRVTADKASFELTGVKMRKDGFLSINYENIVWCAIGNYKLILHPLLDLTKEIEVNGEKFVPIEYFLGNDVDDILNAVQVNDLSYLPYNIIQKLYEWHFDIHGLIEKGLAIDINQLYKEKYK